MTEVWYLVRVADGEDDDDLEEVYVRDAINPFANKAKAVIDDPETVKVGEYPRQSLVELDVEIPGVLERQRRFAGFVVDHTHDRNETELLVLSHDFWIRKATVRASYEDELLSAVIEDLIDRFTPLIWDEALVDLENDETITRAWNGEQLVAVLGECVTISGGDELFGATFDREFYFQPLGEESAPRSFGVGEYLDTDWEQDGKRVANRAVVTYGEGEAEAVVAENNRAAQRELADAIGSDGPVAIPVESHRPEITSETRARDKARQLLEERTALQTGTIDTWEALASRPGQLTPVTDPENDINDDFRIAELEYEWPAGDPPTRVTVADKQIDTADELVALSDDVQRLELQGTDPDAPVLETFEELTGALLEATASITTRVYGNDRYRPGFGRNTLGFGRSVPGVDLESIQQAGTETGRVTRPALNAVRDAWTGENPPVIDTLLVGDGTSTPSRNDSALESEIASFSSSASASDTQPVRWGVTTSFSEATDLSEVGIANGELFARVLTDGVSASADAPVDVSLQITASDDPGERGVFTLVGSQTVRDILADNNPDVPVAMAFGTGETPATVDDTALENQVIAVGIDSFRTRGGGRTDVVARLDETQADNEDLAELGQLNDAGETLTRVTFASLLKAGFELEANQQTQFQNA